MPLIENPLGGRRVAEWIGKHPDEKVPDYVRDRVFLRAEGRCHISGAKIRPGQEWQLEHVKPLGLSGEHRESNLRPALVDPHKEKSAEEKTIMSKADRVRRKLVTGTWPKSRAKIRSRGFAKTRDV